MTSYWKVLIVVCLFGSCSAWAGDIYTCKGANGVNTYQNTPCTTPTQQLGHQTYSASMAAAPTPPVVYTSAEVGASAAPANAAAGNRGAAQSQNAYAATPAPSTTAAYRCTDASRSWIQRSPCPSSTTRTDFVPVQGHLVETGEMITGTAQTSRTVPIRQQELDKAALCAQIRAGASMGRGLSAGSQSYERNKIKRNQCGG